MVSVWGGYGAARLGIPNDFIVGEDIPHDPVQLLEFLGEENRAFYRKVFGSL